MMFLFDIAFGVELIALAAGVILLVWSYRADKGGARALGKTFGYIITIAAGVVLIFTFFHGCKMWNGGHFSELKGGPPAQMMRSQ